MEISSSLREPLTRTMVPVPSCLDLENRGHSQGSRCAGSSGTGEGKAVWDQARDSIGGPEPIKVQPASYNTTVVGSIPSQDLACTPQSGSP